MIRLLSIILVLVFSSGLVAQSVVHKVSEEVELIANEYQLSDTQKIQVTKLIADRNQNLASVNSNENLDEPQRSLKRSSIIKGFDGSLLLILDDDQKSLAQQKIIEKRKTRIAEIEELKKKGYTQSEILKQLDHKLKSH